MVRASRGRTLLVFTLLAVSLGCVPRDAAVAMCREEGRPVLVVPEDHTVPWPASSTFIENGTTIEAGGLAFIHDVPSVSGYRIGVRVRVPDDGGSGRMDVCFVGGIVATTLDPESTPWTTWHATYGFVQENERAAVVGLRLFNTGDGIAFTDRAQDWSVIGVRADGSGVFPGAYIHDDCVEDDSMFAGVIVDSKFDGCHSFLSADAGEVLPDPPDGTGNTVRVESTLVRLQGYEQSFATAKYGTNRHGGFFKFSGQASTGTPPQLVVRGSTFRSDDGAAYGGNVNGELGLPPGSICEDVMLIGTEAWPPEEVQSWVDQCDGLTFGTVADWDERVAAWDADHPNL